MAGVQPIPKERWPKELHEFTLRNSSRRTMLEIDAPDLGAQHEATGLSLKGVSYDPHDDRIEVMLESASSAHLTHTIRAPDTVSVADGPKRSEVLYVRHEGGQTLLHVIR